jgi:hypothetical protein
MACNEKDKQDAIRDCDLLLVLANEQYSISEELMKDFDDFIKFTKPLIVLNLEADVLLRPEFKAYYKSIDFFSDSNTDYLNGEGRYFIDLVFELSRNLPKTLIEREKKIDLYIIVSHDLTKHFDYLKSKYKVKFSHPSEQLNPNFQVIKDCKVLIQ